jgi:ferredoxin
MGRYCVKVDRDLCQGHSICEAESPELFRVVETDSPYPQAEVLSEHPAEALRKQAERAARYCPNGAITIVELDD